MARFVEFVNRLGRKVWINPDCVVSVMESGEEDNLVAIYGADDGDPWFVPGTVAEVLAKLQGDTQSEPAKAGDDITGWWVSDDRVIYVIGFRPDGRIAYLWDNGRYTTHDDVQSLESWTRDPNRKGWEG